MVLPENPLYVDGGMMRVLAVVVVIACGLLRAPTAQAQRLSTLRSAPFLASLEVTPTPVSLAAQAPRAQGVRGYRRVVFLGEAIESGGIPPTRWVEGGIIGATIVGIIGASTAMGLSGSRDLGEALLGFVPGAMIGFPLGALIGGQFPKRR